MAKEKKAVKGKKKKGAKRPVPVSAPQGELGVAHAAIKKQAKALSEERKELDRLNVEEDKLQAYLNKLEADLVKYQSYQSKLEGIEVDIQDSAKEYGVHPLPVFFGPHQTGVGDLGKQIEQHIQDLQALRNFVRARLNMIVKEEELLSGLRDRYGKKAALHAHGLNEFEVQYTDENTKKIFDELKKGATSLKEIRKKVDRMEG